MYVKFLIMSLQFSQQTEHIYLLLDLTSLTQKLQWKMFDRPWPGFVLVPFGPILNSSTDLKVMAMGCGYGLIPIMLTIPLMEKWLRKRETGDCDI